MIKSERSGENERMNEICLKTTFQGILVPKLTLGPFLTLSVRNGPSVSFGTNVP